jgi:hypothetical protein
VLWLAQGKLIPLLESAVILPVIAVMDQDILTASVAQMASISLDSQSAMPALVTVQTVLAPI